MTYPWELYDLTEDWSWSTDVAEMHPEKYHRLLSRV
jgi:hypothetical protein